jgi:hypothetical protein
MTDTKQDLEHLRLLAIFHYVVAALAALFSLFPLIHVAFGVAILSGELEHKRPDRFVGWMLIAIGLAVIACGLAFAALITLAGRSLAQRRNYTFCFVIAALLCLFAPVGTVLGVFTLIVLLRPSVKPLFEPDASAVR